MASRDLRLRFILDALDRVSAPLNAITQGSGRTTKALKATRDELKALEDKQKQATGLRQQRQNIDANNLALDEARRRQRALKIEIDASANPTKKLSKEYERAALQVQRLERNGSEQVTTLGRLSAKAREAGIDVDRLSNQERDLAQQIARTNGTLEQQQKKLNKAAAARRKYEQRTEVASKLQTGGATMMATGAAASAPAFLAAKAAMSFEDALADANKVLNLSNEELSQMKRETLALSRTVPLTPQQIMVIKAAGAEMRIAKGELNAFAGDASKMAVAFGMEAEQAGAQMATWRTSFGLSQTGVAELADQINALTNRMGGNTVAISDIVTKVGPLGQVAGLAAGEIAAMAATLDTAGVQADVAGTGIKNVMLALTKGEAATKKQQIAFKQLGLDSGAVAKSMQKDAASTIADVMKRVGKLDATNQASILTQLFGSESVAAVAPMLTKLDDLQARLSLVGDAAAWSGSMTEEFLARMGTTSAKMQMASNRVNILKVQLGDRLLPIIVKVADKIGALADRVAAWADRNPKLAGTLIVILSLIGPLLIGLGALGILAGGLVRSWAMLAFGLGKLLPLLPLLTSGITLLASGIMRAGMMLLANPILLAIAAIAGAVYLIYRNWDTIGPWFSALWQKISAFFTSGIGNIVATLVNFSPMGLLYAGFAKLLSWLGIDIPAKLSTAGGDIVRGLWNGIWAAKDWLVGKLKILANLIPAPIRKALGIHSPSRVFAAIGGNVMEGLDQGIANKAGGPLARIGEISGQMTRAIAIGAAAPAMAAASPGGAGAAMQPGAPTAGGNHYSITITAQGNGAQDIAKQVRDAIEQIERDKAARGRATFRDDA